MESTTVKLTEAEYNGDHQGLGGGGSGEMVVTGYKLSVIRLVSSGDLMYSMVSEVNNTALYI